MTSSKFQSLMMIILCIITISTNSFQIFNDLIKNSPKLQSQQIHQAQKIIDDAGKKQNVVDVSQSDNLKFTNYTGSSITSDMMIKYIKIINDAYSIFGSNLNSTTDYISKQLQAQNRVYGFVYNVVILLANQTTYGWAIANEGGKTLVVWSKVNYFQFNWTYIIWASNKYSFQTTNYISGLGRGKGIDLLKENAIRNIVKAQQDKYSQCNCYQSDISEMSNKLKQSDGQSWSIICKGFSSISFNSLLKTNNNQYIQLFVSSDKCEYLFAVA